MVFILLPNNSDRPSGPRRLAGRILQALALLQSSIYIYIYVYIYIYTCIGREREREIVMMISYSIVRHNIIYVRRPRGHLDWMRHNLHEELTGLARD